MIYLLSIILFCLPNNHFDHALHLATLHIIQKEDATTFRLTVFQDDCQDALKNALPDKNISRKEDFCQQYFEELQSYFLQHLAIHFDEKKINLRLVKAEPENEVYHLYFKAEIPQKWQSFSIHATYFFELFEDQTNTIALQLKQDGRYRWLKTNKREEKINGVAFY